MATFDFACDPAGLHNPKYDFNDAAIAHGVAFRLSIFGRAYARAKRSAATESEAIATVWQSMRHQVFLAEANHIGHLPTGSASQANDLYRGEPSGGLNPDQTGSILGEYFAFKFQAALASAGVGAFRAVVAGSKQAGMAKSSVWRAIKAGRLSATRTDAGAVAVGFSPSWSTRWQLASSS